MDSDNTQNEILCKFMGSNIELGTDIALISVNFPSGMGDDDTKYQISLRNEVKAMKTKTLSILFALVMILSLSVGVFAQEEAFEETWDEETVITLFSDLDLVFPDLFVWEDEPTFWKDFPDSGKHAKDITLEDLDETVAKAGIAQPSATGTRFKKLSFDACGDGLIKYDLILAKDVDTNGDLIPGAASGYTGPSRTTYIRELKVRVNGFDADVKSCTSTGGDNCRSVKFNSQGEAHLKGYIYSPFVIQNGETPTVEMDIVHSTYRSAFYETAKEAAITVSGTAEQGRNYCQPSLREYNLAGMPSVRAKYDPNTGEARFQATIINGLGTPYPEPSYAPKDANYVIPAEIRDEYGKRYTSYTCKYTIFNTANAAPRTDYCKFGEGIYVAPHGVIRFDITIDQLNGATLRAADGGPIDFTFRVGGMLYRVNCPTAAVAEGRTTAAFEATRFPCPPVTRLLVKDPLYPFLGQPVPFYGQDSDRTIKSSGGIYKNGVWGIYQKCGKYAFMAVRLKNDGVKDEMINLKKVAVAVNGGTPVNWKWVLTSKSEEEKNKILLEPGEDVTLILRAKVTDYPYQLNADTAMTGAINFLDFGFYITGSVYSDHNNTRCVAAPK